MNEQPITGLPDTALEGVELIDVLVQSFSANLNRLDNVDGLRLEIGTSWATRDEDKALLCRFSAQCLLFDAEFQGDSESFAKEHLLATMACQILCEFRLSKGVKNLDRDEIREFSHGIALQTAFPYLREAISSMSTRLGFPRVTIGTFRPGEMSFTTRPS